MANFNHSYNLENKSFMVDMLFYFSAIILGACVLSFLIFSFKVDMQNKSIGEIAKNSLALGSERHDSNKKVLDYKKKIDDFAIILGNHKITSGIFTFLEEKTISNVWFSNFNMAETGKEITLSGEAESMGELSSQVKIFEESQDYIKNVNVLSSKTNALGRVDFTLSILFKPDIFNYTAYGNQ